MIRNLKALVLAGMALAVFGALAASSAGAAEFHSHRTETTVIVNTDGTGKTAHAVLDISGGGTVTCGGVGGGGLGKTSTVASVDVELSFYDHTCTAFGQPAEVHTTKCIFGFKANGEVELKGAGCELTITTLGCEIHITTPKTYSGITYHDITSAGTTLSTPGTATYVTVSAVISGIHGVATGGGCPAPGTFTNGEFTTGNALVEGQLKGGGPMTSVWWA